ncbi:MAG: hypothetical protein AABX66_03290 [Nanoarchaeota archaeon]
MTLSFIKSNQKRTIIEALKEQFGVNEIPYLLIQSGKEKIKAFSGSISKDEIIEISRMIRIEFLGIYLLKQELDYRLSFDATQILSNQITKNILDINQEQYELWIRGYDLELKENTDLRGTIVIRFNGDFFGCGKSSGNKIFNYVPKERRLKTPLPSKSEIFK